MSLVASVFVPVFFVTNFLFIVMPCLILRREVMYITERIRTANKHDKQLQNTRDFRPSLISPYESDTGRGRARKKGMLLRRSSRASASGVSLTESLSNYDFVSQAAGSTPGSGFSLLQPHHTPSSASLPRPGSWIVEEQQQQPAAPADVFRSSNNYAGVHKSYLRIAQKPSSVFAFSELDSRGDEHIPSSQL